MFSQESGPRLDPTDEESDQEREEEEQNRLPMVRVPFIRKVWNRQNGWYRVRSEPPLPYHDTRRHPQNIKDTLAMMKLEIAEMLDDTRDLEEGRNYHSSLNNSDDEEEIVRKEEDVDEEEDEDIDEEEEFEEDGDDDEEEEEEELEDEELYYNYVSSEDDCDDKEQASY